MVVQEIPSVASIHHHPQPAARETISASLTCVAASAQINRNGHTATSTRIWPPVVLTIRPQSWEAIARSTRVFLSVLSWASVRDGLQVSVSLSEQLGCDLAQAVVFKKRALQFSDHFEVDGPKCTHMPARSGLRASFPRCEKAITISAEEMIG